MSCGRGSRVRERSPKHAESPCQKALGERRECAEAACAGTARDCELGYWEPWESCNHLTGEKLRRRGVRVTKQREGLDCEGALAEVAECHRDCRPRELWCHWTSWSPWSSCSTSCGPEGRVERRRKLATAERDVSRRRLDSELARSGWHESLWLQLSTLSAGYPSDALAAFVAGFLSLLALFAAAKGRTWDRRAPREVPDSQL